MIKPSDWDAKQASEYGPRLTASGHICQIKGVENLLSKKGHEMLSCRLEIHEGSEYDGMFGDRAKTMGPGKWPNNGILRQIVTNADGTTNNRFAQLIHAIEHSNPGYEWKWQEGTLEGKHVGIIFREKEYIRNDGTVGTAVEPFVACSTDRILKGSYSVPAKRTLEDQGITRPGQAPDGFTAAATEDDLPF